MISWATPGDTAPEPCPVCAAAGPHPMLLRVDHGGAVHALARCAACASAFYRTRHVAEYGGSGAITDAARQCYIELGAGIGAMARLLCAVDDDAIDSLLDVGCGFGFPADLARLVLGWRTVGIDPSPDGIAGRAMLGSDIRSAYLTADLKLGPPFRLVIASEVIEHVPDPAAFLALLRARMAPGAVLALTTPDGGALSPDMSTGALWPMLSPGLHLVLFSREGLALTLRRAGFRHVEVRAGEGTLTAFASTRKLRLRDPATLEARRAELCRRYYTVLMQRHPAGSALWNGAAARLFAESARADPLPVAFALYETIAVTFQSRFGLDLRHPATIPRHPAGDLRALALRQPFCVPLLVWHRAVLEARVPGRNPAGLGAVLSAAIALGVELRETLRGAGIDDLSAQTAIWESRIALADLVREVAPALAADAYGALACPSPPALAPLLDPPRALLIARLADWFTTLVHQGEYWQAVRLLPVFDDLALVANLFADDRARQLNLLYCLAVLAINTDAAPDWRAACLAHLAEHASRAQCDPATSAIGQHFADLARAHAQQVM